MPAFKYEVYELGVVVPVLAYVPDEQTDCVQDGDVEHVFYKVIVGDVIVT